MTFQAYAHPSVNLAIFKRRLSTDLAIDNTSYAITCDAPVPTDSGLYDQACSELSASYNSMVDFVATGAYIGEVDQYLYNRLDLAGLQLPAKTFWPYIKGPCQTVADLLPQINARSGLQLQVQDVLAYALPTADGCECCDGPIQVPLEAASTSLLYIGQFPIQVIPEAVRLQDAFLQIYLAPFAVPFAA
jgi:hypothetical protein